MDMALLVWPHQRWVEGKASLGLLAVPHPTAKSTVSHLGSKGVGLTHVQLSVHQHTRGLFCQSASQLVFSPRCRTLHLLNF